MLFWSLCFTTGFCCLCCTVMLDCWIGIVVLRCAILRVLLCWAMSFCHYAILLNLLLLRASCFGAAVMLNYCATFLLPPCGAVLLSHCFCAGLLDSRAGLLLCWIIAFAVLYCCHDGYSCCGAYCDTGFAPAMYYSATMSYYCWIAVVLDWTPVLLCCVLFFAVELLRWICYATNDAIIAMMLCCWTRTAVLILITMPYC